MNLRIAIISALLGMLACGAAVASPQSDDIRIIDSAEIIRLGFDPVTDEVWIAPDFDDQQMLQERFAREVSLRATAESTAPNPLTDPIWTSVQSNDFHFRGQSAIYSSTGKPELACFPGSPIRIADAAIQFPNDHRVTWMDVWLVDASTEAGLEVSLWEVCQNFTDASKRTVTRWATVDTTGMVPSPGPVFLNNHAGPDRWTRNAICSHMVRATWSSCDAATDVRLQKVRVLWDFD